jgi:THAP domain
MSCSVCGLGKRLDDDDETGSLPVAMHSIPNKIKNPDKAYRWMNVFPHISKRSFKRICSNHFVMADYKDNKYGNRLLKTGK